MNGINNTVGGGYRPPTLGAGAPLRAPIPPQQTPKTEAVDAGKETISDADALARCMAKLKTAFPQTHIDIRMLSGEEQIRQYALTARSGRYLVVAPDFLEWMATGPQAYQEGMDLLSKAMLQLAQDGPTPYGGSDGVVVGENGFIYRWSVPSLKEDAEEDSLAKKMLDTIKERMKLLESMKIQKKKITIKRQIGYSGGRDMARLARVSTVRDVRSIISGVYSGIFALKSGSDQYEKEAVRQTLNQMEGVVLRAKGKIKNLDKEAVQERRIAKATAQQQLERAAQIRLELAKKRSARRAREHAQVYEQMTPEFLARLRRAEQELDTLGSGMDDWTGGMDPLIGAGVSLPVSAAPVAPAPAAAAVTVTSVNISV